MPWERSYGRAGRGPALAVPRDRGRSRCGRWSTGCWCRACAGCCAAALNRLIDTVNRRLAVEIKPFQLTKRQVLIDRLVYDPHVVEAANEHARDSRHAARGGDGRGPPLRARDRPGLQRLRLFPHRLLRSPARSRSCSTACGWASPTRQTLAGVAPGTTVVFVMNHRSNMDYVLVGLPRRRAHGAQLRGRRMGADLAAAAADPLDGRLLRAPQLATIRSIAACSSATSTWRPRPAWRRRCIPRAACRATAGCASPSSACSTTC